jgi:hypothetical protein
VFPGATAAAPTSLERLDPGLARSKSSGGLVAPPAARGPHGHQRLSKLVYEGSPAFWLWETEGHHLGSEERAHGGDRY